MEKTLSESSIEKKILDIDRELTGIESKKKKLLDMQLDDKIEMDAYVSKMEEFRERSEKLLAERDVFEKQRGSENTLKKRIKDFKSLLEKNQVLEKFDRTIFESIVEKIIVGGADDNGEMNPYKITFVYKTGITCETNAKSPYKPRIGKDVAKDVQDVLSYDDTEVRDLYSNDDTDTVRLYDLMDFNQAFNSYENMEGSNCQTMFGEHINQKEAAMRSVTKIGLNQIKEISKEVFNELPQFYEMFCKRLELLKSIKF